MALLVLAYGAAVTSLGLALATWVPRLGRALTLSVAAYVLVTAGWFFLVLATMDAPEGRGPAAASPFYGVMFPLLWPEDSIEWSLTWAVVYAAVAAILLLVTLQTFDRCLGRIDGRPRGPGPASRPAAASDGPGDRPPAPAPAPR